MAGLQCHTVGLQDACADYACAPDETRIIILNMEVIRSLVDDLNTERGIVRLRVALLLRFSEIKPLFYRSGPKSI